MINYKSVIDLGFTRHEGNDTVFFNEYGFKYFFVTKTLLSCIGERNGQPERICIDAEWDATTRTVRIIKYYDSDGQITGEQEINNLKELQKTIEFYE